MKGKLPLYQTVTGILQRNSHKTKKNATNKGKGGILHLYCFVPICSL